MKRANIALRFKNSQAEYVNTGKLYQTTFYVDESHANGMKLAYFTAVKGDGISAGHAKATLTYADPSKSVAAKGIISETSARDRYGRKDDFNDELCLYPYGHREDTRIGLVKKGVITTTIHGKPTQPYFFIVDTEVVLTGDGTNIEHFGVHGYALKEGSVVVKGSTESVIKTISPAGVVTYVEAPSYTSQDKVVVKCEIGKPLYLNKVELDVAGLPTNLPFTLLKPATGFVQYIGEVASGKHVEFNLEIDPVGQTIWATSPEPEQPTEPEIPPTGGEGSEGDGTGEVVDENPEQISLMSVQSDVKEVENITTKKKSRSIKITK